MKIFIILISGAMFIRLKRLKSGPRLYYYVQIVENRRIKGKVRQFVMGNLGRLEELKKKDNLDKIIEGLTKLSDKIELINLAKEGQIKAEWSKQWGAVLVFRRLWKTIGMEEIIRKLSSSRRYKFNLSDTIFLLTLQRLIEPGSDLKASRWLKRVFYFPEKEIKLHNLYRALDFLNSHKEKIEKALFYKGKDIFSYKLDLIFFDLTSIYFEGEGPKGLAAYGYSRDHRGDRKQIIVGIIIDKGGYPIACEFWPGNTSDIKALRETVVKMKEKFGLGRIIIVADRGTLSKENIEFIKKQGFDYIIGVKMRKAKGLREELVQEDGFEDVSDNLLVREVKGEASSRYIICLNPEERRKARQGRQEIIKLLEERIKKGIKQFISNRGFRQFIKIEEKKIGIDYEKIKLEERYDGKFVLETNTSLNKREIALSYKKLWMVERAFRQLKEVLKTRPIYHYMPKRVKGHIFINFLALYLMSHLKKKLEEKRIKIGWDDVLEELKLVKAIKLKLNGKSYLLRTDLGKNTYKIFQAGGVKIPPAVQLMNKEKM